MFENSWKYGKDLFVCFVDLKKRIIWLPFYLLRVPKKNGVDGQLLYAIKAFYGADWSFVIE